MKKKISLILAFLMTASIMAGCKKTDEGSGGIPETSIPSLTTMSMTESETETTTEASTTKDENPETEETTVSDTETTVDTEITSITSVTSVTSVTSTAAAQTTTSKGWNETEISETLYIKTACYSRTQAIVGSPSVKEYAVGTKINIVAATDTGYYKLADGTFIHSDYVTDQAPSTTTTAASSTTSVTTTAQQADPDSQVSSSSNPISSSYNKSYTDRYPYQQLSANEKQLYANIVNAAASFNTKFSVPDGLTSDDLYKVYHIVFDNEPQLFWLSTSAPTGYGTATMKFTLTRSQAEEVQKLIDSNVSSIMQKVSAYSSTISKLKVIHDWIIANNTFCISGGFDTCGVYNGLTGYGELQCNGYAKTVLYLCDVAGIDCMTVAGNNSSGDTHAWNVVYCDNGYYILDTTWDDPIVSYGTSNYTRYLFFLANDDMIKNSHLNVSTATKRDGTRVKLYTPPACTKTACYYFKSYNKEYSDVASAAEGMYAELDNAIASGKQAAHVKVTSHSDWETLRSNDYWKAFQDYAKSKDSRIDRLNRQTTLTEDILVVEYDIVYK